MRQQSRWLRLIAVLLGMTLLAAACGDDDDTEASDDTTEDTAEESAAPATRSVRPPELRRRERRHLHDRRAVARDGRPGVPRAARGRGRAAGRRGDQRRRRRHRPPIVYLARRLRRLRSGHRQPDGGRPPQGRRRHDPRRRLVRRLPERDRQDHRRLQDPVLAGQHVAGAQHLRRRRPVLPHGAVRHPPGPGARRPHDRGRQHHRGLPGPPGLLRRGPARGHLRVPSRTRVARPC